MRLLILWVWISSYDIVTTLLQPFCGLVNWNQSYPEHVYNGGSPWNTQLLVTGFSLALYQSRLMLGFRSTIQADTENRFVWDTWPRATENLNPYFVSKCQLRKLLNKVEVRIPLLGFWLSWLESLAHRREGMLRLSSLFAKICHRRLRGRWSLKAVIIPTSKMVSDSFLHMSYGGNARMWSRAAEDYFLKLRCW